MLISFNVIMTVTKIWCIDASGYLMRDISLNHGVEEKGK
jgi:hypothetical protein